ncbi:putative Protein-tyrosine-phosphatase MKP1 [Blattamonas nauphoetae]|uniref:Protein-tyrosine-phosphatase n=1 Tax=Blattamonas nauphoetae TaxID=2049346 RepID=A0ABQ9XCZ2_9EUKA|nr:putative Protein-tyrosine-phosphatase MKP1 [Blattamonas nauphoetae]
MTHHGPQMASHETTSCSKDDQTTDILSLFPFFITLIESVRLRHGAVFIHCHQGVSRSAAIVIAYLMFNCNSSFEKSFSFARSIRGIIRPNIGFQMQLLAWETILHTGFSPCLLRMGRSSSSSTAAFPRTVHSPWGTNDFDPRLSFVLWDWTHAYVWHGRDSPKALREQTEFVSTELIRLFSSDDPSSGHPNENVFWEEIDRVQARLSPVIDEDFDETPEPPNPADIHEQPTLDSEIGVEGELWSAIVETERHLRATGSQNSVLDERDLSETFWPSFVSGHISPNFSPIPRPLRHVSLPGLSGKSLGRSTSLKPSIMSQSVSPSPPSPDSQLSSPSSTNSDDDKITHTPFIIVQPTLKNLRRHVSDSRAVCSSLDDRKTIRLDSSCGTTDSHILFSPLREQQTAPDPICGVTEEEMTIWSLVATPRYQEIPSMSLSSDRISLGSLPRPITPLSMSPLQSPEAHLPQPHNPSPVLDQNTSQSMPPR